MEWIADIEFPQKLHGVIKDKGTIENPELYYLYIYKNGKCIWDDLQDTLEFAQEIAFEKYAFPLSAWTRVK